MEKKKEVKMNVVQEIAKRLRGDNHLLSRYGLDLDYKGVEIDILSTSCNIDFSLETYQSRSENVYFYATLCDYYGGKKYPIGYFYIKDNNGLMSKDMMLFAYDIITEGTKITEEIYNKYA